MNAFRFAPFLLMLVTTGATCNRNNDETGETPSAEPVAQISLPGVKTDSLTPRENQLWSSLVGELLSPCADVAVPVAQCVREKRACDLCVPAAEFLVGQVTAGRPKSDIAEIYASRFDPKKVKTIVEGDSAWKGAKDPLVTVIEFADFECPACGAANPLIEMMYEKYGKQMRLVFKHFPLAAHPNAKLAAQAAYAAHQQGLFWKMHKLMFDNQLRLTEPDLVQYATEAGLDVSRFKKDMHSEAAKEAVNQDKGQGESLGVSATPTIYINGRDCDLSKLANPVKDLESWIELDIAEAKKKGRQPAGDGN